MITFLAVKPASCFYQDTVKILPEYGDYSGQA